MSTVRVYDNIILSKNDYEFYKSIPIYDQILFLYDLCLEVEPQESLLNDEVDTNNRIINNELLKTLATESNDTRYVHVIILEDLIIFAGNLESSIQQTKNIFYNDGFVFLKNNGGTLTINDDIVTLKQFFSIVEIHDLISITNPLSIN